jgi:hypothetical protein
MRKQFRPYLAKLHRETLYYLKLLPFMKLQGTLIIIELSVVGILVSGIFLSSHSAVLACGGSGVTCNQMFASWIGDLFHGIFHWIFDLFIKGLIFLIILFAGILGLATFLARNSK